MGQTAVQLAVDRDRDYNDNVAQCNAMSMLQNDLQGADLQMTLMRKTLSFLCSNPSGSSFT